MNIPTKLLMVRPVRFGYNVQTAESNLFQNQIQGQDSQAFALEEFDGMVSKLREYDIPVIVVEDTPEPETCDSIFPNNWFSTHGDGTLVLYPMLAPNRRLERAPEVIRTIMSEAGTKRVLDLSEYENEGKFLEGTGSMVLDRKAKVAYACLSPRTSSEVLDRFCSELGYRAVVFNAEDQDGNPIYHTNVVMSVGEKYAVLCKEAIRSSRQLAELKENLRAAGKTIVDISLVQMFHFAGNILEVRNIRDEHFVVMSETANAIFTKDQLAIIGEGCSILPVRIPYIEVIGGGSARCMMAEILCPQD